MSVSVLIPMYTDALSENEKKSINKIKKVFCNRSISVVCPNHINDFVKNVFSDINFTVVNFPATLFTSTRSYNRLLTSLDFYNSFRKFSHILICQTDVYPFKDELDKWCNAGFHFIGAPTFEGYSRNNSTQFKKTLNGGFSLRDVAAHIQVLEAIRFRFSPICHLMSMEHSLKLKLVRVIRDGLLLNYKHHLLHPVMNEDLYWSYVVPRIHKWFLVPEPEVASLFSYDAQPKYLYMINNKTLPMAIHAWWRYDLNFVMRLIEKNG